MSLIVIDSSFALAWCFEDEVNDRAEQLLNGAAEHDLVTLPLWRWEVANALVMAMRRKRIREDQVASHIAALQNLGVRYDEDWMFDFEQLIDLAKQHTLTIYDTAYLQLALRLQDASLATLDGPLESAARKMGVTVI